MPERIQQTWDQIRGLIAAQVNEDIMDRWFAGITLVKLSNEEIFLQIPNQIYEYWIETNFQGVISKAIELVTGTRLRRVYQCADTDGLSNGANGTGCEVVLAPPKSMTSRKRTVTAEACLNPRYNFNSFVVGEGTKFAHAAGKAIAQSASQTYNPLFIYGDTGLGKTHLMHAIGNAVVTGRPKTKVIYVTSEQFTNDFIAAIAESSLVKFRRRYREADVLLIDDIQFFADKARSQEEFFHTFNTIFTTNRQIVLSADCAASRIKNLEHRLVSRFESGMTAEIAPPDTETRTAILKKKMTEWQLEIDPLIIDFLADRIRSNVRRLEGALIRLASYGALNRSLAVKDVELILEDILRDESAKDVSITDILKLVADYYDLKVSDLLGRKRPANIALARQVAMYFARELTHLSYQEIGEALGGRDHGTIMHGFRTIEKKLNDMPKLRQQIDTLHGKFSTRPASR